MKGKENFQQMISMYFGSFFKHYKGMNQKRREMRATVN